MTGQLATPCSLPWQGLDRAIFTAPFPEQG